jgi:hypothetical protein
MVSNRGASLGAVLIVAVLLVGCGRAQPVRGGAITAPITYCGQQLLPPSTLATWSTTTLSPTTSRTLTAPRTDVLPARAARSGTLVDYSGTIVVSRNCARGDTVTVSANSSLRLVSASYDHERRITALILGRLLTSPSGTVSVKVCAFQGGHLVAAGTVQM